MSDTKYVGDSGIGLLIVIFVLIGFLFNAGPCSSCFWKEGQVGPLEKFKISECKIEVNNDTNTKD